MTGLRVLCLRHGESTDNATGVLSATCPGGALTATGRAQAADAAAALRGAGVTVVYASRMRRAAQTARIVADALGTPVATLPGLAEYGLGECEGSSLPADRNRCAAVLHGWIVRGDLDSRLPGGECGRQVVDRFTAAMAELAACHRGQTVAVVSHVGTLSLGLVRLCADLGSHDVWGRQLPHAVPFPVEFDGSAWRCPSWPGVALDVPVA